MRSERSWKGSTHSGGGIGEVSLKTHLDFEEKFDLGNGFVGFGGERWRLPLVKNERGLRDAAMVKKGFFRVFLIMRI